MDKGCLNGGCEGLYAPPRSSSAMVLPLVGLGIIRLWSQEAGATDAPQLGSEIPF